MLTTTRENNLDIVQSILSGTKWRSSRCIPPASVDIVNPDLAVTLTTLSIILLKLLPSTNLTVRVPDILDFVQKIRTADLTATPVALYILDEDSAATIVLITRALARVNRISVAASISTSFG